MPRVPAEAAGRGGVRPHLPTSLAGPGRLPRLCWLDGPALSAQPPDRSCGGAEAGARQRCWCVCGVGRGHRSARSSTCSEQRSYRRPARRGGSGRLTGRPHGGPKSNLGHTRPPVARDQQVITLQLQGREGETGGKCNPRARGPVRGAGGAWAGRGLDRGPAPASPADAAPTARTAAWPPPTEAALSSAAAWGGLGGLTARQGREEPGTGPVCTFLDFEPHECIT